MSYGGSGGGSGRIATAADAALSNPTNGDVLTYDATLQKWVNGVPTPGSGTPDPGTFRVDSYGAKGDGSTDDLTAIKAAIAALPDGGRLVFTPSKTYVTSATIEVANKAGVTIVASGATLTTTSTDDAGAVLVINNCTNAHVIGGYLYHKNVGTRKNAADGLTVNNCSNVLVEAVNVGYVYSIGIRIGGSTRVTVTSCTVNGSTADGIGAYGGERYSPTGDGSIASGSKTLTSAGIRFQGHDVGAKVTVYGAGTAGGDLITTIASRQSDTQVILADAAQTSVTGTFIRLQRHSSEVSIIGNHLIGTGDDSISSVGYLFYASPNTDIVIQGNTVVGGLARGILLCGTTRTTISGNNLRDIKMGGIFGVVETGGGNPTSYGVVDMNVVGNNLQTICTDFANGANYPAIGAASTDDANPIRGLMIANNVIRDAYSYYIEAGGYGPSNTAASCVEVMITNNVCLDGNRNNPGIYILRATNIAISGNRIAKARTSAIAVSGDSTGATVIRDNVISQYDRIGQGFGAIDAGSPSPSVINNVLNGVNVASGTSGGGSNA